MNRENEKVDFKKNPLVPAVIQDVDTGTVLMLGYMNRQALEKTVSSGRVTFFSRSRGRLWTKGETSGNFLDLVDLHGDCDGDALLVRARPLGPTCHRGRTSCFDVKREPGFVTELERVIRLRRDHPEPGSYCSGLFSSGVEGLAQKVGEEAVEVVIEAMKAGNPARFIEESADLVFHLLVLLVSRDCGMADVINVLKSRRKGIAGGREG